MPQVMPASSNTFVPVALAKDKLVVDFARDPKKFKVAQYTQVIPVEKDTGYYLYLNPDESGRILNTDARDFVWYDAADTPRRYDGSQEFEFRPYRTTRYYFGFTLGWKAVQQASWEIVARHAAAKAQQAMTLRTQLAANVLLDSTRYDSSHVINATSGYGAWSSSTQTNMYIYKTLMGAAEKILDDTLGMVTKDDLVLVIGTGLARKIAAAPELTELVKYQAGFDYLRGMTQQTNVSYGVPESLYGFKVVVDETRKVTTKKGASTRTVSPIWPDNQAVLLARPGGMEGAANVINFAACCLFMFEEMTVEQKDDPDNRRTIGRVVEDYDVQLVAPAAAVLITNIT
ncbi:MAG TPA: hypothetical protein PK349_11535 [Candidatus Hydrogenedentes bacterium]|nr:hypothetical protein [Candidatus Hydrogenedentota bacterium]